MIGSVSGFLVALVVGSVPVVWVWLPKPQSVYQFVATFTSALVVDFVPMFLGLFAAAFVLGYVWSEYDGSVAVFASLPGVLLVFGVLLFTWWVVVSPAIIGSAALYVATGYVGGKLGGSVRRGESMKTVLSKLKD